MSDVEIFFDKFKSIGIDLENGALDTTPSQVFIFDPSLEKNKEIDYTNKKGVTITLVWTKEAPTLDIHSVDDVNAEDLFFSPPSVGEAEYLAYIDKCMQAKLQKPTEINFEIRKEADIDVMNQMGGAFFAREDKRKAWESPYGYQRKSHKKK